MTAVVVILIIFFIIVGSLVASKNEAKKEDKMWEIFVPASGNEQPFSYDHHKKWDAYVKSLAGGLTIMKTAKGEWIDDSQEKLYRDKVIPVRVKCSKKIIKKIIKFTITHYNQEAVLAYKVSDKVMLIRKS